MCENYYFKNRKIKHKDVQDICVQLKNFLKSVFLYVLKRNLHKPYNVTTLSIYYVNILH